MIFIIIKNTLMIIIICLVVSANGILYMPTASGSYSGPDSQYNVEIFEYLTWSLWDADGYTYVYNSLDSDGARWVLLYEFDEASGLGDNRELMYVKMWTRSVEGDSGITAPGRAYSSISCLPSNDYVNYAPRSGNGEAHRYVGKCNFDLSTSDWTTYSPTNDKYYVYPGGNELPTNTNSLSYRTNEWTRYNRLSDSGGDSGFTNTRFAIAGATGDTADANNILDIDIELQTCRWTGFDWTDCTTSMPYNKTIDYIGDQP